MLACTTLPFRVLPLLAVLLHFPAAVGECRARLPVASTIAQSARIVAGLAAAPSDFDNIVTIAEDTEQGPDYFCIGSLVAPEWVLTVAQCFIRQNTAFVLRGATSLSNTRYSITATVPHPGAAQPGQHVHRDDIQLLRIHPPVRDAVLRPSPSPTPAAAAPAAAAPAAPDTRPTLPANPNFNFMYINNNTDFAMDQPRYLRLKGFGIVTQPQHATEPLRFRPRDLKFADLRTAPCGDSFGNDAKRRLCTERDDACGACYGDTGAPLYDVDSSGTSSVLVGLVTFGTPSSTSFETPICTGDRPVAYTAVARYADWISDTIRDTDGDGRVFFYDLPKEGITNTDLSRDNSPLAIFATTSVIVISCLALLGTIVTVIITCVLRRLRKKRKRWLEGLQAEESFVKAGEKDAIIVDPFEGIQNDQKPRFSFTGFSRAAVKGATEFSSRSIGMLKALVAREREEDFFEPRELMDDSPGWVPGAWDRLFMPPSKKELNKIHKIPTQRVVDDVLSGGDKSVELSLEEVAYKAKRDEANLETAWAKLEIQTSMRNHSEAGGSTANIVSPSLRSPSTSPMAASPRKESRNSSRVTSPLGGSGKPKLGDLIKADTLLAAFASIDAESEQVAEETTIDSSALRALAEAKRPNVLATLRRKFSSGGNTPSMRSYDRESDGEGVRTAGSVRADLDSSIDSRGGSRYASSGSRLASGRSSRVPTALSSVSGIMTKSPLGSRQSSMLMDYFSEDYGVSSDDEERVSFEDMFDSSKRRYTEDRKPQMPHESRSILSFRGMRTSQNRSFESLERNSSTDSLTNSQDLDDFADLSIPRREHSSSGSNDKSTIPRDERYKNLPMSTSSVSSDKRPRSSTDHSGAGPSSQTQTYSELVLRQEEQVSVHMEDEPSVPMPSSLPDRAEDYQSSRIVSTKALPSQDSRSRAPGGRPMPSADSISVHMEEETGHTGSVASNANREDSQTAGFVKKDRVQVSQQGHLKQDEDMASVHMEEDAQLSSRPNSRTKMSPSADVPRSGASQVRPLKSERTARQKSIVEDRVSVYMEEVPSFEVGGQRREKDNQASDTQSVKPKEPRPASERLTSKARFDEGDTLSVHMEEETSADPSVRARISKFDESEKSALRQSEPSPGHAGRASNVSVTTLKNMWNEMARRNSDDSNR